MSPISRQFPISLRTWSSNEDKSIPLSTLIQRINNERVSFRSVTEESLQDEIRRGEIGLEANKDDVESENEDAEEEPDRLKVVLTAREEILTQLEQAHQASMLTLDFVSLLLSKDTPVQASLSISPALRDAVSLGTLGVDKVQDSRVTKTHREDIKAIAKGWKLQALEDTADSILASATKLEKEIEKETKYWEQVLTVTDEGWAVCRLPHEKHTLGVRFGFAESAPAFQDRSLGALRRNADGTIMLDRGIADATPKRVRVRIQTDGVTTGEVSTPEPSSDPESFKSLILAARNTIFEEELWQELNREARALANQGVRLNGDDLVCPITSTKQIVLDLQEISAEQTPLPLYERGIDDGQAEIISLALRLLLSYAHRQNLRRRSQPPQPISDKPPPNPPYNLLRPIIAGVHHEAVITSLNDLLLPLSQALRSAGTTQSSSTCTSAMSTALAKRLQPSASTPPQPEVIVEALISNLTADFELPLTSSPNPTNDQSLKIKLRTVLFPLESRFILEATGPIATSCKPPSQPSFVEEVKVYILWAAACALANTCTNVAYTSPPPDTFIKQEHPEEIKDEHLTIPSGLRDWQKTHNPTILRKTCPDERHGKEISFKVSAVPVPAGAKPQVRIMATYVYVVGATTEDAETTIKRMESDDVIEGARGKGVRKRVWRSEDLELREGAAVGLGNGDEDEDMGARGEGLSLRDFVERVGRWDGSESGE